MDGQLQLSVNGTLQPSVIAQYFGLDMDSQVSGQSSYQAHVQLPADDGQHPGLITVHSDLDGITVDLPTPFAKLADQKRPLDMKLHLVEDANVEIHYGHNVHAGAQWVDRSLQRGYLGVNRSDLMLPEEAVFLLAADVREVNLVDWQSSLLATVDRQGGSADNWLPPVAIDVRVGTLGVSQLKLDKVHLTGTLVDSVLRTELASPEASGRLNIPLDNAQAMDIDLQYLHLPELSQAEQDSDSPGIADFDPRTLRSMNFSVAKLTLGERALGGLSFLMQASEQGLDITGLQADILGLQADGEFHWNFDGHKHHSRYRGAVQSPAIADVFANFGLEPVIKSEDTVFQSDLSWAGRPWEIERDNLTGQVTFTFEKGTIQQTKGGSNPFIRVVGLLNFGSWLRRLKLDFSDVFGKGLSYDNIHGSLIFDNGYLRFPEPIVAKAPSGTMKMYGNIDLVNERIDTQLVATLPVGTNLPWVAALAVNLPAAAGAWLISKIFKKQVNKLSSLSYKIHGSWDDPEFEIEKVFSDKKATLDTKEQPVSDAKAPEQAQVRQH